MDGSPSVADAGVMLTSNGYTLDDSPSRLGRMEPVPDAIRSDKDALWDRLRRDGYLYLPQQLDPQLVASFREYYFTAMADTGITEHGSDPAVGIGAQGEIDRAKIRAALFDEIVPGERYAALTGHPDIRGWFEWFLGDDVHLHRRKIIRHIRPGESGIGTATQAHYDLVYLRQEASACSRCGSPWETVPSSKAVSPISKAATTGPSPPSGSAVTGLRLRRSRPTSPLSPRRTMRGGCSPTTGPAT